MTSASRARKRPGKAAGSTEAAARAVEATFMDTPAPEPKRSAIWRQIPTGVWALGLVSLLMDVSSEMIHALLPVYLVVGLGATALTVGIIEGVAEATASITKVFSGALSDRLGKRKLLAAVRLWPRGLHQAGLPPGDVGFLAGRRALCRPGRQGHPRRAPRRARRRHQPAAPAWRELRTAAVARYRRRLSRPAGRDRR